MSSDLKKTEVTLHFATLRLEEVVKRGDFKWINHCSLRSVHIFRRIKS